MVVMVVIPGEKVGVGVTAYDVPRVGMCRYFSGESGGCVLDHAGGTCREHVAMGHVASPLVTTSTLAPVHVGHVGGM